MRNLCRNGDQTDYKEHAHSFEVIKWTDTTQKISLIKTIRKQLPQSIKRALYFKHSRSEILENDRYTIKLGSQIRTGKTIKAKKTRHHPA